jgi:diaminohydroxyphosphoribosylaminopyrimidine deaminase/5-amino-6-(5-phosphoribosylamino)uracil reductase
MLHDGGPRPELVKPVTPQEWDSTLRELGSREITALLLEGGGELAAAALRAGAVNKVAFFVAPKVLGGRNGRPVVGGADATTLDEALALDEFQAEPIGSDILLTGYCRNVYRTH